MPLVPMAMSSLARASNLEIPGTTATFRCFGGRRMFHFLSHEGLVLVFNRQ